ncbi:hypothetical protein SK128_002423 [Halocaridina rubra]|uniref:Uncharacterized protein n=1 Tax=Halocaridina rubra TaxID=373956 RepID=A0AAN8WWQ0_HALRR
MPPYGEHFRNFFSKSDSNVFQALASLWDSAPSVKEGLMYALQKKEAHIEARRFLELVIAEQFTKADGSTDLYLGRESIFPGLSAWPIPHDAPYKYELDRCILAIIENIFMEAGLYEKWSQDVMEDARKRSRERHLMALNDTNSGGETKLSAASSNQALTIVHMQGALMLHLLGLIIALLVFISEIISSGCASTTISK